MKRRVIYPARRRTGTYRSRAKETLVYMRKHWMFYAMLALPILYYVLFHYKAMPGVVIAFKNYNIFKGIWESPWVGMKYFQQVARSKAFWLSVRNMLVLNIMGLVLGFPLPIILALFLNEINHRLFKKTIQTVIYLPHFISWSVVGGMMYQVFASSGLVNTIIKGFGGNPIGFLRRMFPLSNDEIHYGSLYQRHHCNYVDSGGWRTCKYWFRAALCNAE